MSIEEIKKQDVEKAPIASNPVEGVEKTPEEIEVLIDKMVADFIESKKKRKEIENNVGLSEQKSSAVWLSMRAEHEWNALCNGLSSLKHNTLGYLKRLPGSSVLESTEDQIKSQENFDQIMKKFGDSIIITESSDHMVKKHLEELNLLPENLVHTMKKEGLKVRVGRGNVDRLSGDTFSKRGNSPSGHVLTGWGHVGGVFDPVSSTAYIGNTLSGSRSTALHEYGHGVGHLLQVDNSQELSQAHRRFFNRLESYYKQEGAGGYTGKSELLAESFAEYFTIPREKFIHKYDQEWYSFLSKIINEPR